MSEQDILQDHTIALLVADHPGVLSKITSLITRRGFNIDSIAAGPTKDRGLFRLTVVVKGDDRGIEQIQKQLYKLVDTVKVVPIHPAKKVEREIGLVKLRVPMSKRSEVVQMVQIFKGEIIDAGPDGFIVEISGDSDKIESFLGLFQPSELVEVARTGIVAMDKLEKGGGIR
jgi:acetolactate synthase I/III small subunit